MDRDAALEHEARSGRRKLGTPTSEEPSIRPLFDLVERHPDARTRVLAPSGELDAATNPAFREAVQSASGAGERLVVDLSEVSFMSAGAIGVIARARTRIERGQGQLVVVCPSPRLYRLFEISGLAGKLDIRDALPA